MTKKEQDLVEIKRFGSVKEMMDDMKARHDAMPWYAKLWFNIEVYIWCPIWNIISHRRNWNRLVWFWQRRTRGWDDTELWSLDHTIAKFMVPRLKRLKEVKMGYPANELPSYNEEYDTNPQNYEDEVYEEYEKQLLKEWDEIIDKMINAFELVLNDYGSERCCHLLDNENDWDKYKEELEKYGKEVEEGLQLFAKFYGSLWD
jgi:hypothetical protein